MEPGGPEAGTQGDAPGARRTELRSWDWRTGIRVRGTRVGNEDRRTAGARGTAPQVAGGADHGVAPPDQ